jgi:general L-amino acid transport system substrate-binding protein
MRKLFLFAALLIVIALIVVACAAPAPAPSAPATVVVTREVPVTVIVEVTPEGAAPAPQATQPPSPPPASTAGGNTLKTVQDRGRLVCGVHGTFQGFGFLDPDGKWSGFDVDFCRAWAAALFDDPEAVDFRGLSAQERFTALQAGEVDVLSRNSTWTLARDTELGLDFGPTTFYDGQAMMVKKELIADPAASLADLAGASVCVQTGTTTELNLSDQMRPAGAEYTPVVFEDQNAAFQAYEEGRCDGITSDRSQLATQGQAVLQNPADHIILDVVMSKEPLAPAVRHGDNAWGDVVHWVVFGLIQAEELGINSQNVDDFLTSEDPVVRRLLGVEGDLGLNLGVTNDFIYRAIKQVGNYGEIFERNLSQYGLTRGQNATWQNGGLLYSPPFR